MNKEILGFFLTSQQRLLYDTKKDVGIFEDDDVQRQRLSEQYISSRKI